MKIYERNLMAKMFMSLQLLILLMLNTHNSNGCDVIRSVTPAIIVQDTLQDNQVLYSGKLWRNLYMRIKEDQFLFDPDFMSASVSIGGKTYSGIPVKYDIYNDEIISHNRRGMFIQLNKEHIDSFSLNYTGKTYRFMNYGDSIEPGGYLRVLYDSSCKFLVKYKKNIELMAIDKKFDSFYLIRKMYFVKDGNYQFFNGRMDLLRLFGDRRKEVKAYMRKNRVRTVKENPDSYIPIIEYYDRLSR